MRQYLVRYNLVSRKSDRQPGHYRQYHRQYRAKKKLDAMRVAGEDMCCSRCGFDHPAAIHFHHRDPAQKSFEIMRAIRRNLHPWDVIVSEIAKCDLLCANCHAIEHNDSHDV